MTMALGSLPTATTMDVESLVSMAWRGGIRVPHFQRDFRWNAEDVRRLFDSIARGYPIGSLLLWVRPAAAQKLRLGALTIDAPAATEALWVVDGQQRITSLANALHPDGRRDPRFALGYDLRDGKFVGLPKTEDPLVVPLPVLFDLQRLILWFTSHPGIADYLEPASRVTRTLRQFTVPAYQVRQADQAVLQDIFDRMNNYGKRLARHEIFNALNAGEERGQPNIGLLAERIAADLDFGIIDGNTVLQAVLAPRGADVKRDVRGEFVDEAAFEAGEDALRRAVAFLQREASVPHFSMLAYRYLLVPLARLFAHHPEPDPRNLRLLRRWYWRAALAGPQQFKAGTGDAARLLCSRVREDDLSGSVQGLIDAVAQLNHTVHLNLDHFATNQAATKMLLCAWWADGPRNPATGQPYELSDLAATLAEQGTARDAVRYLVPSTAVPRQYRPWAANRVLMPAGDEGTDDVGYLLTPTRIPDGELRRLVLDSHSLTDEIVELFEREPVTALKGRQDVLVARLGSFLNRMCEWDFEDTPPLTEFELPDEDGDGLE